MQSNSPILRRDALAATALLILLGGMAGFVNGLLGTGGGILLVLVLGLQAKQTRASSVWSFPLAQRDIYANALTVMLPISVFSAMQYARAGTLDIAAFSPMILPSLAGGVIGGILLDRLKLPLLRQLFSLLILISGILMVVRG